MTFCHEVMEIKANKMKTDDTALVENQITLICDIFTFILDSFSLSFCFLAAEFGRKSRLWRVNPMCA